MDPSLWMTGRLGAAGSFAVLILGCALFAAIALTALGLSVRPTRRARASRRAERDHRDPRTGDAVLCGTVRLEAGDALSTAPVEIVVHQRGEQYRSDESHSVRWTETSRELRQRPFELELPSGERVPVAPNERVRVIDTLEPGSVPRNGSRTRSAVVKVGETAWIVGTLGERSAVPGGSAGYRSAAVQRVLLPPASGRMLIATQSPSGVFAREARVHYVVAACAALAGAAWFAISGSSFLTLARDGERIDAVIARRYIVRERDEDHVTLHYHIDARRPTGAAGVRLHAEVNRDVYDALAALREPGSSPPSPEAVRPDVRAPFVVSRADPTHYQLGAEPGITAVPLLFALFGLFVFGGAYAGAKFLSRPWWELESVDDNESGELPNMN